MGPVGNEDAVDEAIIIKVLVELAGLEQEAIVARGAFDPDAGTEASKQAAAALVEIEADSERLLKMLPEAVARHARRLRQRDGMSVAYLSDRACGSCFGQLPMQQGVAVSRGSRYVRCPSCSRFIVHRPWN